MERGADGTLRSRRPFATLQRFVDHYNDPAAKLRSYDLAQVDASLRSTLVQNSDEIIRLMDVNLTPGLALTPDKTSLIVEFLKSLTDPAARDLRRLVPSSVPSGLPIDR